MCAQYREKVGTTEESGLRVVLNVIYILFKFYFYFIVLCGAFMVASSFSVVCQSSFLLAAEQKGFELLELRGEDPRLASLDTLSGDEIPLHFLFRLHGYIIQVCGATSPGDT